jgi:hypothetical protein
MGCSPITAVTAPKECATCLNIGRKQRRLQRCAADIRRWSNGRERRTASIEVARQEAADLNECIAHLCRGRYRAYQDVTNVKTQTRIKDLCTSSTSIVGPVVARKQRCSPLPLWEVGSDGLVDVAGSAERRLKCDAWEKNADVTLTRH